MENEQKKTNDTDAIVLKEKNVTLSGENYLVEPYGIFDIIKFSRVLIDALKTISDQHPGMFKKDGKDKKVTIDEIIKYLPLLLDETPKLVDLFALSIKKDGDWLGKQKDFKGFSELFLAICEVNEFGEIFSNFQKGWKILKEQRVKA